MSAARCLATFVAAGAWLVAQACFAGRPTMEECFEGSDFIGNAALSRDAGVGSDAFLGRMEDDFQTIRAFPNDLRWFVHDADDEAFLLRSARDVFEHPEVPEAHRSAFLRSCIERMAATPLAPTPAPAITPGRAGPQEPTPLSPPRATFAPAR